MAIPATAVRVWQSNSSPSIEWLPDAQEPAKLELGTAFSADAVSRSRRDLERNPQSVRAMTNLAQALWQAGDQEGAAHLCEQVLASDPPQPGAMLLLARIRDVQGRTEEAKALYEQAHHLRPADIPPLLGLAQAAIRRNEFSQAVGYLRVLPARMRSAAIASHRCLPGAAPSPPQLRWITGRYGAIGGARSSRTRGRAVA